MCAWHIEHGMADPTKGTHGKAGESIVTMCVEGYNVCRINDE